MNNSDTKTTLENKTILVVEDEISNYLLIEAILKKLKARILQATNGIEAIEVCNSGEKIDLVLMDIKMPEMDGKEATIHIKKQFPTFPVIALTAFAFSDEKEDILQAGFEDYITKPIIVSELKEMIFKYIS